MEKNKYKIEKKFKDSLTNYLENYFNLIKNYKFDFIDDKYFLPYLCKILNKSTIQIERIVDVYKMYMLYFAFMFHKYKNMNKIITSIILPFEIATILMYVSSCYNISHLFWRRLNVKQFDLNLNDLNNCYKNININDYRFLKEAFNYNNTFLCKFLNISSNYLFDFEETLLKIGFIHKLEEVIKHKWNFNCIDEETDKILIIKDIVSCLNLTCNDNIYKINKNEFKLKDLNLNLKSIIFSFLFTKMQLKLKMLLSKSRQDKSLEDYKLIAYYNKIKCLFLNNTKVNLDSVINKLNFYEKNTDPLLVLSIVNILKYKIEKEKVFVIELDLTLLNKEKLTIFEKLNYKSNYKYKINLINLHKFNIEEFNFRVLCIKFFEYNKYISSDTLTEAFITFLYDNNIEIFCTEIRIINNIPILNKYFSKYNKNFDIVKLDTIDISEDLINMLLMSMNSIVKVNFILFINIYQKISFYPNILIHSDVYNGPFTLSKLDLQILNYFSESKQVTSIKHSTLCLDSTNFNNIYNNFEIKNLIKLETLKIVQENYLTSLKFINHNTNLKSLSIDLIGMLKSQIDRFFQELEIFQLEELTIYNQHFSDDNITKDNIEYILNKFHYLKYFNLNKYTTSNLKSQFTIKGIININLQNSLTSSDLFELFNIQNISDFIEKNEKGNYFELMSTNFPFLSILVEHWFYTKKFHLIDKIIKIKVLDNEDKNFKLPYIKKLKLLKLGDLLYLNRYNKLKDVYKLKFESLNDKLDLAIFNNINNIHSITYSEKSFKQFGKDLLYYLIANNKLFIKLKHVKIKTPFIFNELKEDLPDKILNHLNYLNVLNITICYFEHEYSRKYNTLNKWKRIKGVKLYKNIINK